ncbi:MAG: cupin domain-containing protein [Chloroflexi bacterium]|nr:cupin domain-containing protein [Chloroflexota bacterium]
MANAIRLSEFKEFDARRPVSKLLYDSDKCRLVLFCLEPGQEISPHTSTSEVVFYGVDGECTVLVGDDTVSLQQQTIVTCPPNLPHGIKTVTRAVVMAVIAPRP